MRTIWKRRLGLVVFSYLKKSPRPDGRGEFRLCRNCDQPIAAAFTSSSMKGTYCAKLSANICTSLAACAS